MSKKKPKQVENVKTDWRQAFVKEGIITEDMCVEYSCADSIRIERCGNCNEYQLIAGYVSQFDKGGFWYGKDGLHFVTRGVGSDEDATYEDALEYIKRWRK